MMKDLKKLINAAAISFGIGFWFAAGATLSVVTISGFTGFEASYILIVDEPEQCEGGACE